MFVIILALLYSICSCKKDIAYIVWFESCEKLLPPETHTTVQTIDEKSNEKYNIFVFLFASYISVYAKSLQIYV